MKRQIKKTAPILSLLVLVFIWTLVSGCGGSNQGIRGEEPAGNVEDIDALLGLTDDTPKEKKTDEIADDDVLKLLGVKEEAPVSGTEKVAEQNQAGQQRVSQADTKQKEESVSQPEEKPPVKEAPRTTLSFQERYQEARQLYLGKKYRDAIQKFQALLDENMRHSLSDNCQYWIGESYWGLGDYQQAAIAFEKVFTFQNSNKDPDAQLKLGLCYRLLGDKERAKQEFQKLIDHYPSSEYVSLARKYLAELQ